MDGWMDREGKQRKGKKVRDLCYEVVCLSERCGND